MNCAQHGLFHFVAPAWLLHSIAVLFFAGACFYLYRLLNPDMVKNMCGWSDWENEIAHGICMLAMASALAPMSLQLPAKFWAITLTAGGVWFIRRAFTYGRKLEYNKLWWDWSHVFMLLCMALMFYPLNLGLWLVYFQEAFFLWLICFYAVQIVHDLREPKALRLGSDLSHMLMGIVMLLMMLLPSAFAAVHRHHMMM